MSSSYALLLVSPQLKNICNMCLHFIKRAQVNGQVYVGCSWLVGAFISFHDVTQCCCLSGVGVVGCGDILTCCVDRAQILDDAERRRQPSSDLRPHASVITSERPAHARTRDSVARSAHCAVAGAVGLWADTAAAGGHELQLRSVLSLCCLQHDIRWTVVTFHPGKWGIQRRLGGKLWGKPIIWVGMSRGSCLL